MLEQEEERQTTVQNTEIQTWLACGYTFPSITVSPTCTILTLLSCQNPDDSCVSDDWWGRMRHFLQLSFT